MDNSDYKVLLVEDEENIAKLFMFSFKRAGFICEWAENGIEGLSKVKEFKPDIIISDIMMPEMDGYEFRKNLLKDPALGSIPFIFLTAKGEESDILEGYDLDIEDYIVKTSSPKVVVAKLTAKLKSSKKARQKAVDEVHEAANKMGAKVLPDSFPEFEGFEIKHWHVPFQDIPGGDFIDYFQLDDDHLVVVLGDIMGKKWGAWYFAVAYAGYVRSAIRFVLQSGDVLSPGNILNKVNDAIYKDERLSEVFITLSILILDKANNKANYSGAGDLPLLHKLSNDVKEIRSNGILLGFSEKGDYEDVSIWLNKGDVLFVTTDGITESRNSAGEFFGSQGMVNVLTNLKKDEDPLEKLKTTFTNFTNGNFEDDVSLISIRLN